MPPHTAGDGLVEHHPSSPPPTGSTTGSSLRHPLVLYRCDDELHRLAGEQLLADHLADGAAVIVVATPAHRAGIRRALHDRGVDVDAAVAAGTYLDTDASELLASVTTMDGYETDRLGEVLALHAGTVRGAGRRLVLFSEMASLLWEDGLAIAALEFEGVGDRLLRDWDDLELICAYPTRVFSRGTCDITHVDVCERHTHQVGAILTPEPSARDGAPPGRADPLRKVAWDELALRDQMLDAVGAAVIGTDLDGTVHLWSDGARRLHGWTAEQAVGRHVIDLTMPATCQEVGRRAWVAMLDVGHWEGHLDAVRGDGTTFPAHVRNRVLTDPDGRPVGVVGIATDMSEQVERERAIARRGTWLRNVTDLMGEGLATLDARGRVVSVNPYGRELLGVDGEVVGGSFVNRLVPVRPDGSVAPLAELLIGAEFDGHLPAELTEARLLRSDGTTVPIEYVATRIPEDHDGQPNGWVVVFRNISDRLQRDHQLRVDADHATWMARIRDALDHDRFVLHAQPIVDLRTKAVVQHELLVRMQDPELGLVAPAAFMPIAETYGLAPSIDRWVIRRAIELAATGRPVEVNLSARSFADPALPHLISQQLDETGTDPSLLVFELTETAMLDNEQDAALFAERIRAMGCQLALDDFGTGYGAFLYLKRLPVDVLKIDIEFVRDACTSPSSRHVITAVVTLARSLGIQTVAEGVEDAATLELLLELGVDRAQGYLLGRPVPVEDTTAPCLRAGGPAGPAAPVRAGERR